MVPVSFVSNALPILQRPGRIDVLSGNVDTKAFVKHKLLSSWWLMGNIMVKLTIVILWFMLSLWWVYGEKSWSGSALLAYNYSWWIFCCGSYWLMINVFCRMVENADGSAMKTMIINKLQGYSVQYVLGCHWNHPWTCGSHQPHTKQLHNLLRLHR